MSKICHYKLDSLDGQQQPKRPDQMNNNQNPNYPNRNPYYPNNRNPYYPNNQNPYYPYNRNPYYPNNQNPYYPSNNQNPNNPNNNQNPNYPPSGPPPIGPQPTNPPPIGPPPSGPPPIGPPPIGPPPSGPPPIVIPSYVSQYANYATIQPFIPYTIPRYMNSTDIQQRIKDIRLAIQFQLPTFPGLTGFAPEPVIPVVGPQFEPPTAFSKKKRKEPNSLYIQSHPNGVPKQHFGHRT